MKNILSFSFFLAVLLFASCDGPDDIVTAEAAEGGLVEVQTKQVGYLLGIDQEYPISILVKQGAIKTTKVDVYKQFTDATGTSELVYLESITTANEETAPYSYSVSFDELREGIVRADGTPIPESDATLEIGNKWDLIYKSTLASGVEYTNSPVTAKTTVAVATPFAGTYEVIESNYFRIGAENGGWNGDTRIIESVDQTTYFHGGYGPFDFTTYGADGAFFYFEIDDAFTINYFQEYDGVTMTGLGSILITCETNPADMVNVPCGAGENIAIFDEENGEHILRFTYGYFTDGSGPREFYEVMKKID